MFKSLSIIYFLFLNLNLFSQVTDIENVINSNKKSNTRLDKSFMFDLNENESYKKRLKKEQLLDLNYQKNINNIFKEYDDLRNKNEVGLYIVKGNNILIKSSLLCFNSVVKMPILCDVAEIGLEKIEVLVKEKMDLDARRLLKNGIDNLKKKVLKEIKNEKNPQVYLETLEKHSKIMEGLYNNLPNATPEDKQVVLSAMLKIVDEEIKTGFNGVNEASKIQANEIEQVSRNVSALSMSFYKFAVVNNMKLNTIIVTQAEINSQLEKINKSVGKTEKGVEFLQDYFFTRMSPNEQINALRLKMVPGVPEGEREELIQKISLYEKQQKLNTSIKEYLDGASEVVNIAQNFGLDKKIVAKLSSSISIGTNVFNAYTAFQSGNVLQGISAVSNIFGAGGPDVASERHSEIMEALGNIYQKLDIIDAKIEDLKKGQQEILKNQKKTFEALIAINKQINENQKELTEKLETIHKDVLYNRQLMTNYVLTKYTSCYRMTVNNSTLNNPEIIISTAINKFPKYNELLNLCHKWSSYGDINNCFEIISQVRKYDGTFDNPIFNIKSSEQPNNYVGIQKFIDKVHDPLLEFMNDDVSLSGLSTNQKRTSLFVPNNTIAGLDTKIEQIKRMNIDVSSRYSTEAFPNSFQQNISTPLWFEAIERHIDYILNIHYYRMMIDRSTNKPYSKEMLLSSSVYTAGYYDLKDGLVLLDFAIAQQNMYSGDILLPILSSILDNKDSINPAKIESFNLLINSNSLLANNFIKYKFRKEVLSNSNYINYDFGYLSHDKFLFKLNFKNDWDLVWNDSEADINNLIKLKGWSVKIGNVYYPVPTSEDLQEGKLTQSQNTQRLINLKTRVLEEIDTYEVYDNLSIEERKTFNILNLSLIPEVQN